MPQTTPTFSVIGLPGIAMIEAGDDLVAAIVRARGEFSGAIEATGLIV